MKSLITHYKNKYPGGHVQAGPDSLDVHDFSGNHVVALRRNGAGQLVDESEELGCLHRHDMSPIPRDSRIYKLHSDDKIGLDDEADKRKKAVEEYQVDGRVPSCDELEFEMKDGKKVRRPNGWRFDQKGNATEKPAKAQVEK